MQKPRIDPFSSANESTGNQETSSELKDFFDFHKIFSLTEYKS